MTAEEDWRCQPQRASVGGAGWHPARPKALRAHPLTLPNPLPAGPAVAQEEGAGADDHDQHEDQPEERGPWDTGRPSVRVTVVSQGRRASPRLRVAVRTETRARDRPGPALYPPSLPRLAPGSPRRGGLTGRKEQTVSRG